jgi:hypothetical protein
VLMCVYISETVHNRLSGVLRCLRTKETKLEQVMHGVAIVEE